MNYLLTGTAGFIGYHVAEKLLKRKKKVFGLDNLNNYYDINLKKERLKLLKKYKKLKFFKADISNSTLIKNIFKRIKPDIVINLAAQAGVRYSLKNPHAYVETNVKGFLNILEECKNNNVKHLVYASTSMYTELMRVYHIKKLIR